MKHSKQDIVEQLAAFSADELAALLADLAREDKTVAKAVAYFLRRHDPKSLSQAIRRQISGLKRRSRFVDYYETDSAARELHAILNPIERDLIPADPVAALKMLAAFIETDSAIIGNADDSNGVMADAYDRACHLLGVASTAAGKPAEAEEVFLALHDFHDYGTRDVMFDEAKNILSEEALERLITQWRARAKSEDFNDFGGIRVRLGQVTESIGDPVLHEEASLCGRPVDEYPLVALDVARVYLACGQPDIALTKVPSEQCCRHPESRNAVLIEIHRALGNTAALAQVHWSNFERDLLARDARAYLENIPPSEHAGARERMRHHVIHGGFPPLREATFFAEMDEVATAAAIVEAADGQFSDEHYAPLLDLTALLEPEHPLAATILYRANLESHLNRKASKYYRYAVRYAKKAAMLARSISDWKEVTPHEAYWQAIQQTHARKRSFWEEMQD